MSKLFVIRLYFIKVNSYILESNFTSLQGTRAQWQTCFFISAAVYFIGWLSFMILGTSDERECAKQKESELMDLYKGVQKFVKQPPKSPSAQSWVASELEKKDT